MNNLYLMTDKLAHAGEPDACIVVAKDVKQAKSLFEFYMNRTPEVKRLGKTDISKPQVLLVSSTCC